MTISYHDRVKRFVKQNQELCYAYLKIQTIYLELEHLTFEKAPSYFENAIKSLLNSTSPEFVSCGNT